MVPKAGKVSVVVTNSKLADNAMVERRRGMWREMLNRARRCYLVRNDLS